LYRHPRERAEDLIDAYRAETPSHAALETIRRCHEDLSRRQARRLTALAGTGRGLEIGSYVGAFLDAAHALGWDFRGIDVNETANAFERARGRIVRNGTIEDCNEDPKYDAVAFWNCFDQLPDP